MRYHHARVVLAACLAATAAAQASINQPGTASSGPSTLALGLQPAEPRARLLSADGRVLGAGDLAQGQGQESPYTLTKMFADAHGDFMNRRERFDPAVELGVSAWPNQRIGDEPGSFDWLGYDFDVDGHVLVAPDGYLTVGAFYNGRTYQFSSATGLDDESLAGTGLRVGFGVFLGDNVLLEVESMPGVWSDLDGTLHHEDLDYPSFALVTYRALPELYLKIGARYNQIYEEAPWLPYVGVSWEAAEGFRIDLLAPETLEFSFWPSPSLGILFGTEVQGAEYHVRSSLADRLLNPDGRSDLRVQEWTAYVGLMSRMSENFSFTARAGMVLGGWYELTTGAAGFDPAEGQLDQAAFADFSFGFDW